MSVTVDGEAKASSTPEADALEVVATANNTQVKAGDKVAFEVTVRNHGSEDLEKLKVTDANGNLVTFTGTQLDAGSAARGTAEVTVQQTTSFVLSRRRRKMRMATASKRLLIRSKLRSTP